MTSLAVFSYMLHYAQTIRFSPKVSTRFEPCSVFSSYSCSLYDRIIFCDPPTAPCDSHHCDPPHPKIRGTRLPPGLTPFSKFWFPPNTKDKSTPKGTTSTMN